MENQDLGSKKMNNKLNSDDLISNTNKNDGTLNLKSEIEVNEFGEKKVVERARNTNKDKDLVPSNIDRNLSTKPSLASEQLGKKLVENQDLNSDIAQHRYSNSNPENHKK